MIRALTLMLCFAAGAEAASAEEPRFYDRASEGWFWYRDPPPEPEPPEEPDPAAAPSPALAPAPAAPAGPKPLSSAWLKTAIPLYLERAIDEPTPDNVRVALYLQRIASDKAAQYAELSQMVTLGDPFLDTEFERPLSNFAAQEVDRAAYLAQQALVSHLAGEIGLIWFYRSDCPFCERQAPVMQAIGHATGVSVMTVSLDGAPMPSGAFAESFVVDRGQAAALGVQTTPTIFVMRPASGDVEMVAQGMMELRDLEARILLIARRRGWISEQAWEATRPVNRTTAAVAPADLDPAVLEDPDAFIAHLRAAMKLAP
jgi:conjugal transfer pilus assembly protein TraF